MARYDYRCTSCGTVFEVEHGMTEHPAITCPCCGNPADKVFSASGIKFEGSGFQLVPVTEAPLFQLEAYQGARELAAGAMTARGMLRTSPARSAADGHFCARLVRLS